MIEKTIAKNIQGLRKQKKMTLQNLAERTGLSKGYLSKIERTIKSPPFSTLNQIAMALEADVTFFFTDTADKAKDLRLAFTKNNQGKIVETLGSANGYKFKALAHEKLGKNMIPYIIEPAFDEKQIFQHEGEEFIYVLEGKHEFIYDDQKYLMEEGDSVYFDASVPHTGKSLGGKTAKLLAVIFNYKRL